MSTGSGGIKREADNEKMAEAEAKRLRTEPHHLPRHIALAFSKFAARETEIKELESRGVVTYKVYTNDGQDESGIALIGLINIFSKQLPKMPKNYICRLVMDLKHSTLALLKDGEIIGGICYKPVWEQRFAEIAFCAVNSTEQVRGFGTIMMNKLKDHVQKQNIEYFLTFADNYAIGYFQKQAFVKNVTMPKQRWVGHIKEYDGANLMECYIPRTIKFTEQAAMLQHQRRFLLRRIIETSHSHVRYPPIELFRSGKTIASVLEIPGVLEGQWTPQNTQKGGVTERDRNMTSSKLTVQMKSTVDKVKAHECSWPFLQPVREDQAPGYTDVVRNPVDLETISARLREQSRVNSDTVYYRTKAMLRADLIRMVDNCKLYNPPGTEYYDCACSMELYLQGLFDHQDGGLASSSTATLSGM